jgi:FtsP/CotA-like multicopper oxidase with cupredoxin domain
LITDWVHDTAYIVYETEMMGRLPLSDSIVVNGHGHYNGSQDKGSYYETVVTPNKKHLLKLINGGVGTSFVFSIDGHNLTVIANDLVPVKPFSVESLFIGIGKSIITLSIGVGLTDFFPDRPEVRCDCGSHPTCSGLLDPNSPSCRL